MKDLKEKIKKYRRKQNLSIEKFAEMFSIKPEILEKVESGDESLISEDDKEKILNVIDSKIASKKSVKILDLIFRFGATIMSLVTLLLCINGNVEPNVLIALLAIGVGCSSITLLPKIDK